MIFMRQMLAACAALAMTTLATSAIAADTPASLEGIHEGAEFQISRPASWNGGLVMFAHGYEGEGSARGTVVGTPLDSHLAHQVKRAAFLEKLCYN